MTEEERKFMETVRSLRRVQRDYFRTKSRDLLIKARRLEAAVDRMLEGEGFKPDPSLFDDGLGLRVAVVEYRLKSRPSDGWSIAELLQPLTRWRESDVVYHIVHLNHFEREYRYRYATLAFEEDGRRCITY